MLTTACIGITIHTEKAVSLTTHPLNKILVVSFLSRSYDPPSYGFANIFTVQA